MKKGFCNRIISMIVVICMILTLCPATVLAANEGDPSTITAGQLVAGAYGDLSREEKELIGSGLLADVAYEYYTPDESDELIRVDTENKTIAADSWTDRYGNVWEPVKADIIVNGSSVESVTPDGEDTYGYDGNAFSVEVSYVMYLSVDADVQEQMLNTAGWLKDGIANLDTIAAQSSNMGLVEMGKTELLWLCDDANYPPPFKLSADGKEAIMHMNLKNQYAEFGIGTELLNLLMDDLRDSGFETIRYEISPDRYSVQIYKNLGFEVESKDEETVRFVWKRQED